MLYDEAIYYTPEEYYRLKNQNVDIQTIVEEPELYIIGQCRANDDQIMFTETRNECLQNMMETLTIYNGAEITDKMRFAKQNLYTRIIHMDANKYLSNKKIYIYSI